VFAARNFHGSTFIRRMINQREPVVTRLGIRVKDDDLKAIVDYEKERVQERSLQRQKSNKSARHADWHETER